MWNSGYAVCVCEYTQILMTKFICEKKMTFASAQGNNWSDFQTEDYFSLSPVRTEKLLFRTSKRYLRSLCEILLS